MSFTVNDFNDFKQLLSEHPDWQVELRRMIISADLEALPAIVRDLAEAQRSFERRLVQYEESIRKLEKTIEGLVLAEARNEAHFKGIDDKLGRLEGGFLELRYYQRVASYFGRWLRRVRLVDMNEVVETLDSRLGEEELDDLLNVDLVVSGRPRGKPESEEVWLAVEVSTVVDRDDVARAVRRAALLRRAGRRVVPVVGGESATKGAKAECTAHNVALLQDGTGLHWEEALAAWAPT
jgi:hypothetical protein